MLPESRDSRIIDIKMRPSEIETVEVDVKVTQGAVLTDVNVGTLGI